MSVLDQLKHEVSPPQPDEAGKKPTKSRGKKYTPKPENVAAGTAKAIEERPWLDRLKAQAERARPITFGGRNADGTIRAGGPSLNPGGRQMGVVRLLQYLTQDGEEHAVFLLAVARGEITTTETRFDRNGKAYEATVEVPLKDRIDAHKYLFERQHGKNVDRVLLASDAKVEENVVKAEEMSKEEAVAIMRVRRARIAAGSGGVDGAVAGKDGREGEGEDVSG